MCIVRHANSWLHQGPHLVHNLYGQVLVYFDELNFGNWLEESILLGFLLKSAIRLVRILNSQQHRPN